MSLVSPAAPWYPGVLFAAVEAYFLEGLVPAWWALRGAILISMEVRGGLRRQPPPGKTIGDIIRGSWGEE